VLGAGDRVATQITSSPVAQGAITLVSNVPRGSFVFGIAATVATLGATTLVVAGTGGSSHPVLASATAPAAQRAPATVPLPAPAAGAGQSSSTTAGSGASVASTTSYAWANPGSGSTGATGAAVAGLSAGSCVSSNGVAAPGAGFSYGAPLGLANAQAVADTPAVDLTTTGPSLSFSAPATITPYGSSVATDSATLATDVCLSSRGSWFTAVLTDDSGSQVQLQGSLQQVIGSGDDLGYVFRGTLNPTPTGVGPLGGAGPFVVEGGVVATDNTSQSQPTTSAPTATSPAYPTTTSPATGGNAPTNVPPSSQSSTGSTASGTGSGNGALAGGSTQVGAGGSAPPMLF
jgi:hypothetical protein